MSIYKYRVYRSANIGIFMRANDDYIFVPKGFAHTKASRLEEFLSVKSVRVSLAYTRLLGPFMVVNNHGIVVASIVDDDELNILRSTGLKVARLNSRITAVGNLIAVNDRAAIVSTLLDGCIDLIKDTLSVKVAQMSIASYHQVGAVLSCTNKGAVVHPNANDEEIERVSSILEVDVEPATVNGGVPFVSSGIVANSKAVVVGSLTTGPEMVMLSRAFKA
ncbi:MAG: translation initiation factor IF-6 [Candidatus Nitrosocaldus sp.]